MTRHRGSLSLLIWACLLALPASGDKPLPGRPIITSQQAVQAATDLALRAGLPVGTEPVGNEPWAKLDTYISSVPPMWRVGVGPGAEVSVDAYTGQIRGFVHYDALNQFPTTGGPRLTEDEAVLAAQRIVDLLGLPADARLESARWINPAGDRPDYPGERSVLWRRWFGDIPCEDILGVTVHAGSGQVIMASKSWDSLPPDPVEFRLTPDQAVQVASDILARKGKPADYISPVEIKIVRPNGYWSGKMVETTLFKPSRIAYVMTLWSPETYQYWDDAGQPKTGTWYWPNIVWVDVDNGSILGGTSAGGAGPLAKDAQPYQPGNPVPTAFKELPKLPPPPPFTSSSLPAMLTVIGAVAVLGGGGLAVARLRRRRRRSGAEKKAEARNSEGEVEEAELPQKGDLA